MMFAQFRLSGLLLAALLSWLTFASARGDTELPRLWTVGQEHQGCVAFQHPTFHFLGASDIPRPEEYPAEFSKRDVPDLVTGSLARGEYGFMQIGIHALAADFDGLAALLENNNAGLASQRVTAHYLLLPAPDSPTEDA